jgi:hypothetical protein
LLTYLLTYFSPPQFLVVVISRGFERRGKNLIFEKRKRSEKKKSFFFICRVREREEKENDD